ncbi:cytochrome o ubiquinol oxidase subunit IV [Xaviernesmea oryzae]|uniref:Cytochrome bo(3) ubiquinol oxidase subunit 4 n=1 Tax=Xaviernesmea oryzae TaxID=464029 RepID=A0A1Q9B256_9HYPH|nr:cytochrome o ubiquinol oxidase subunit IV [Xaviernesmea oryzae]OLP62093.1 cytochrome o ubiquinol oxidase subunit IV [Xaviernesmea oryzae]SEL87137.1 cytochrome o ubiquinol oxidase operon protein cyoD [Xaviernesmea oryzae]
MTTHITHHEDAHQAHHGHSDGHDAGHGSMKSYMTGFILSVILTAVPFWLVMGDVFSSKAVTVALIMVFAAIQIVVHMVYFLHMNSRSEGGWTLLALIFTFVILVIALSGSLWVMHHLNINMMPVSPDMMRNAP